MKNRVGRSLFAIALAAGALLASGCVSVNYVGQSYPPTTSVDIYYDAADITRPYSVMGRAQAIADEGTNSREFEQGLRKEAMSHGADAVLVEGMTTREAGSFTNTNGSEFGDTRRDRDRRRTYHYSETSSTTISRELVLETKFLKYK